MHKHQSIVLTVIPYTGFNSRSANILLDTPTNGYEYYELIIPCFHVLCVKLGRCRFSNLAYCRRTSASDLPDQQFFSDCCVPYVLICVVSAYTAHHVDSARHRGLACGCKDHSPHNGFGKKRSAKNSEIFGYSRK